MFAFFLKGLAIGFSIAAPVGPIGVLCIQRTLSHGRLIGFASGLGAATADATYGVIAAFGLTFVSGFLMQQQFLLRLVGGIFLLWLAWKSFSARPHDPHAGDAHGAGNRMRVFSAYGSTVLLTLANPATILSFVAVFAGLGVGIAAAGGDNNLRYQYAAILVLGVFLGSALWWLLLAGFTGYFRNKMDPQHLVWVNRGSGVIIAIFGGVALTSLFFV
jgi:threonine/homoserine/homoserine lactone efflux protein